MSTNRQVFFSGDEILTHNAQYYVLVGGRNLGKSYWTKNIEGLSYAWQQKKPTFMIVRREDADARPSKIENYFGDSPVEVITGGEYNTISAQGGNIYFATADPVTGKTTKGLQCGYYVALKLAHHIKSNAFPFVRDIIYEEFIPEFGGHYLDKEPDRLLSLCSTVFRSELGRVWLIGNSVSRISPYYKQWKLNPRQKINTILDYEHETIDYKGNPTTVKISVQYCPSTESASGMYFGKPAEMINEGAFVCNEHPRLQYPPETYTTIYEMLLRNSDFNFVLQLLSNDETGQLILYAYPHTDKKQYQRILSLDYDEDPFHTVYLRKDIEIECVIADLLNAQKIAFSDNLTGDEFISTLKMLRNSTL